MTTTTTCDVLFRPETDKLKFLPEGPYQLRDGSVSWVGIQHGADSTVGSINILNLADGTNTTYELPGRPGFAFPTSRPQVFIAGVERSIGLLDCETGKFETLISDVDRDVDNTIINDGLVFEDGILFGCKELEFKTKKAGLYWFTLDEGLRQLRSDQICSNGKAILNSDPERLDLIDIDSPSRKIIRCTVNLKSGLVSDEQVVVDLTREEVFPDGLITTPDGKSLIVAIYDPRDPDYGVARQYSIHTGELEHIWTCPGSPRVTCPQLLQQDGCVQLLLTTAIEHMPPEQRQRHPNAGCLFVGKTSLIQTVDPPIFPLP